MLVTPFQSHSLQRLTAPRSTPRSRRHLVALADSSSPRFRQFDCERPATHGSQTAGLASWSNEEWSRLLTERDAFHNAKLAQVRAETAQLKVEASELRAKLRAFALPAIPSNVNKSAGESKNRPAPVQQEPNGAGTSKATLNAQVADLQHVCELESLKRAVASEVSVVAIQYDQLKKTLAACVAQSAAESERMQAKIAALEKEVADKAGQLHSMAERLQLSSTESATAAAAHAQRHQELGVRAPSRSEFKAITSDDVWNERAFLYHREQMPHVAHPMLFCRETDRKDLTCQLCFMLLVRPIALNNGDGSIDGDLLPCGDGPYCDACVRRHLVISPACPACQQPTQPEQLVDDTRTERAVRSALVRCAFYLEGCEWTGEVRHYETHQSKCAHSGAGTRT